MRRSRGFTLIEIVVVLGVLGILATVVMSVYAPIRDAGKPRTAQATLLSAFREAYAKSVAMEQDSAWGVRILTSSIIVFSGASYATRTSSLDISYTIPPLTQVGTNEVVFTKFTGTTTAATVTFSNQYRSASVSVAASGLSQ